MPATEEPIATGAEKATMEASPLLPALRAIFRMLFRVNGGIQIDGVDRVPRTGRLLICPNHISDCDPSAILVACPRNDIRAMAKSELFSIPILGGFIRAAGAFPVKRDSADRAALRYAESILASDQALLLFPEGRCSSSGSLQTIQPGAALLALKTNSPILPVGLVGTNRVVPYGAVWPRYARGGAQVMFGQLIETNEFQGLPHKQAISALARRLERELANLTGQNLPLSRSTPDEAHAATHPVTEK